MDIKQIQELIKIINRSNIGELSIEQKDFKITIRQKEDQAPVYTSAPPTPAYSPSPTQAQPNTPQQAPQQSQTSSTPSAPTPSEGGNYITIKSPMIGTFYRTPGPDKPAFVNVGDEVTVGQPVCIIEAMKLFNEIESEVAGKIVKVLIDDASPVEYDQPLFLVDPS
jgi:acetyl-CoA carboxylase biotin carboxyl carrier protein